MTYSDEMKKRIEREIEQEKARLTCLVLHRSGNTSEAAQLRRSLQLLRAIQQSSSPS